MIIIIIIIIIRIQMVCMSLLVAKIVPYESILKMPKCLRVEKYDLPK